MGFQIFLHLAIVGHLIAYYVYDVTAVGGLDFQDFFHSLLGHGVITYAVVFAGLAYATSLIFGRLFCSWGCHFGALQDAAAWLLTRIGWRAPFVKTRFLHHAPWLLLGFVFLWPNVTRWLERSWALQPVSDDTIAGAPPWENLPGVWMSAFTLLGCGVALLFFLGRRGFCRFVCPYGALFRVSDLVAPFRVRRVSECATDCSSSGTAPCTIVCPTAIDVHAETERAGSVQSIDCVHCNLCIEACPSDALAYRPGFRSLPVLQQVPSSSRDAPSTDCSTGGCSSPASRPATVAPNYTWSLSGEFIVATTAIVTFVSTDLIWGGHFLSASLALILAWLAGEVLSKRRGAHRSPRSRWAFGVLLLIGALGVLQCASFKILRAGGLDARLRAQAEQAAAAEESARRLVDESSERLRWALVLFPDSEVCREALVANYLDRGDPRALSEAEEFVARHPGRRALEALHRVLTRLGLQERARLVEQEIEALMAVEKSR